MSNRTENQKIEIPKNYSGNAFRETKEANETQTDEKQFFELPDIPVFVQNQNIPRLAPPPVSPASSPIASLFPKIFDGSSFPFGHGIGGEELFIIGMMLLIYMSGQEGGEVDGELLIMLCILLFSG